MSGKLPDGLPLTPGTVPPVAGASGDPPSASGTGRLPAKLPLALGVASRVVANPITGDGAVKLGAAGQPRQTHRIAGAGGIALAASGQPNVHIAISGIAGLALRADGTPRQTNRISTAGQLAIGASGQPRQAHRIMGEATLTIDGSGRLSLRLHITGAGGLGIGGAGQPLTYQRNTIGGAAGLSLSGAGQPGQTHLIAGDGSLILAGDGGIVSLPRIPISGRGGLALAGAGGIKTWLGARVSGSGSLALSGDGQPVMTYAIRGTGTLDLAGLAVLTMGNTIRGTGKLRLSGRDSYTGPGSGLHTSHPAPPAGALGGIPDTLLWTLREGDAFRVVIPYGGGSGRTGLARVMSRTINEQGVLSLKLQLVADDAMPPISAEAVGVGPRIRPDERGNLARRVADSERRIHRLQHAENLRR